MSRRETTRVGVSHQVVTNLTSPLALHLLAGVLTCVEVCAHLVPNAAPSLQTPHLRLPHLQLETRTGTTQSVSGCHLTWQPVPDHSRSVFPGLPPGSAPGAFRSVWSGIPLQTAPEGKKCSNLRVWKEARFSGRKLAKIGRFACRFQPPSTPTQI